MSENFTQALGRLNPNQRTAVEQIDGPLLVVAGPGTGKTQLLSARVAHILQQTDTLPQNILCLTFTESGASNMRERLTRFIGQAAYDVTIGTYHAFGGDLIGRFPQYFGEHREQRAADRLAQREVIQAIVEAMPYSNPLKNTQYHLHDLLATISEVKKGLLTEDDLRGIAQDNLQFLADVNEEIKEIFAEFSSMPRKAGKALPYFENLLRFLAQRDQADYSLGGQGSIRPLADVVRYELEQAVAEAQAAESTKPLTAWKNHWLEKDADNRFIFAGKRESQRVAALADVFRQYQDSLAARDLYDFDDMILRSIKALEAHPDLRFTLQEQYQYILLDEFQDTNAAQLKLIKLLTNNPVSEGRPNVMAVGDDDQAIYAFQGAEVSNMLEFAQMYRDTMVINLTDNYRSHPEILHVAHQVAGQIGSRLTAHFADISKTLAAANHDIPPQAHIDRHEFQSDVGQYSWIAEQIAQLVKDGAKASDIAVLAPRHKQLEPLVSYLNQREIPVRYEKRENILEAPVVQQIVAISRLALALKHNQEGLAASLWPEVLSYNFWNYPTSAIWQLSWRVRSTEGLGWSAAVLQDETFRPAGLLLLALAQQAGSETLETILDRIIGSEPVTTGEADLPQVTSPLRAFYLGADVLGEKSGAADLFYQTLSHLTVLRQQLRDHQQTQEKVLLLQDMLDLIGLYEAAGERMLNTSPYNQHAEAVQLMTVFKAKGLEFEHVFLPSCQDDVWGESSRGQSNRLTLPPNLAPIRPAGTTQDERLRIFFVAVTRAKLGLHLTSYLQSYSGRATKRLKYLNEVESGDGGFKTLILPAERQDVRRIDHQPPRLDDLELNWRHRHVEGLAETSLRDLLSERLANYQLSPTHLCSFVDLIYAGPEAFFFNCLLNFPSAPSADAQYGNAMHETLQWYQLQLNARGPNGDGPPTVEATQAQFEIRLRQKHLRDDLTKLLLQRGQHALGAYLAVRGKTFKPGDKAEYNFRNEGVLIAAGRDRQNGSEDKPAHLTGKVDRLVIDQQSRTITVIDYKTGAAFNRWSSDHKLHKYRLQLYCYKLMIESSRSFRGYTVGQGILEFVEPDDEGRIHYLELSFDQKELETTKRLLQAVWQCVCQLKFPDVSGYDQSLTGIKQFESVLLANSAT